MKEQLKRLNKLKINLDLFYVISFYRNDIKLQGVLTKESYQECKKFVDFEFERYGEWLEGSSEGLSITLTLS